jgi:hypothetical protein
VPTSMENLIFDYFCNFEMLPANPASAASAASDSDSRQVVAVCGPNGAVQVVDADKVPVGCHVSTINTPPAGHG